MSTDMLGSLIEKCRQLRGECIPTLTSLVEKLGGRHWHRTLRELKKFVREEPCWVSPVDATKLTIAGRASAVITAIRTVSASAFAFKAEDASSPFGFGNLLVALRSWATKKFCIQGYDLLKKDGMTFLEMIKAVGGEKEVRVKHLFSRDQIRALVNRQAKGEAGLLLVNGCANLFFTLSEDGVSLSFVDVGWVANDGGWGVWSSPASGDGRWYAGDRLFLRAA